MIDYKYRALCQQFNCSEEDIEDEGNNVYTLADEPGEYMVLTDSEAEDAFDAELESYIDECVLTEMPEQYHQYFDREKWKRDAQMDGRGCLASYDGEEREEQVDGHWYFIYRVN